MRRGRGKRRAVPGTRKNGPASCAGPFQFTTASCRRRLASSYEVLAGVSPRPVAGMAQIVETVLEVVGLEAEPVKVWHVSFGDVSEVVPLEHDAPQVAREPNYVHVVLFLRANAVHFLAQLDSSGVHGLPPRRQLGSLKPHLIHGAQVARRIGGVVVGRRHGKVGRVWAGRHSLLAVRLDILADLGTEHVVAARRRKLRASVPGVRLFGMEIQLEIGVAGDHGRLWVPNLLPVQLDA